MMFITCLYTTDNGSKLRDGNPKCVYFEWITWFYMNTLQYHRIENIIIIEVLLIIYNSHSRAMDVGQ